MEYYNGYTPQERDRKLRAMHKVFPRRSHPYYQGACDMCGDPDSPVAPHTEDYSEPYLWERPAEYALCNACHGRLHKRFNSETRPNAQFSWAAYKNHVARGGYGCDLKSPPVARQIRKLAAALQSDEGFALEPLRHRASSRNSWWESLTTDPTSLKDPSFRPR